MSSHYRQANRAAWTEGASVHERQTFDGLKKSFAEPGFSCLDPIALEGLQRIGFQGQDVIQPCCNNGRDLISVKNLGAARCCGIDFSAPFIEQAREVAAIAGVDCSFSVGDILEIDPGELSGFDIVMITEGSIRWIPELAELFRVCRRLLGERGWLLITDLHPLLNVFGYQLGNSAVRPRHSYFDRGPFREETGLDYFSGKPYDAEVHFWFQHTLGEIVTTCIEAGFRIVELSEFERNLIHRLEALNREGATHPMSFRLLAQSA
jgi:SAM-dependent methyltransferase